MPCALEQSRRSGVDAIHGSRIRGLWRDCQRSERHRNRTETELLQTSGEEYRAGRKRMARKQDKRTVGVRSMKRACLPLVEVSPGRMQRGYAASNGRVGTQPEPLLTLTEAASTVRPGKRHTFTIKGEPMGKPRMTRRDKWKQRPCVLAYRSWADSARAAFGKTEKVVLTQPTTLSIVAYFSIPASWSTYKK